MAEFTLWVLKLSEKIEKEDHDQVANPMQGFMGGCSKVDFYHS